MSCNEPQIVQNTLTVSVSRWQT